VSGDLYEKGGKSGNQGRMSMGRNRKEKRPEKGLTRTNKKTTQPQQDRGIKGLSKEEGEKHTKLEKWGKM